MIYPKTNRKQSTVEKSVREKFIFFFLENVHCYSPFECYLALPFHYCYSENKKEMKAEHLNIGKRKTVKK